MAEKTRAMPSPQWSCSELEQSNQKMLKVNREAEDKQDLERKIKETLMVDAAYGLFVSPSVQHIHEHPTANSECSTG